MILSTSDKERLVGNLKIYVGMTVFFAIFGAVYEYFGHQVYSEFMIYAFLFPLLLGVLPAVMLLKAKKIPAPICTQFWGSGVLAYTLASTLMGALEIYGTTNGKLVFLVAMGVLFTLLALITGFAEKSDPKEKEA